MNRTLAIAGLAGIAGAALLLACGAAPSATGIPPGGEPDPRYALELRVDAGRNERGRVLLRVTPLEAWHLVPDSPESASLAAPGLLFEPHEARAYTEDELKLAVPYQREVDGDIRVTGQVKFGICQDDMRCVVIRRDLDFDLLDPLSD